MAEAIPVKVLKMKLRESTADKLRKSFYIREDVVQIARDLLGMTLCTFFDGDFAAGLITETEAYAGVNDRASHAYGDRITARTEVMYHEGGVAYVYLCYGIHHLFNVVVSNEGVPHAVLVRGVLPVAGNTVIAARTGKDSFNPLNFNGPGKLTRALGIKTIHSGTSLLGSQIWISDNGYDISGKDIIEGKRIGVDYAGPDANLPYRFNVTPEWQKRFLRK
jgi:DNA-3-methyladenine glycosylase